MGVRKERPRRLRARACVNGASASCTRALVIEATVMYYGWTPGVVILYQASRQSVACFLGGKRERLNATEVSGRVLNSRAIIVVDDAILTVELA